MHSFIQLIVIGSLYILGMFKECQNKTETWPQGIHDLIQERLDEQGMAMPCDECPDRVYMRGRVGAGGGRSSKVFMEGAMLNE